MKKKYADVYVQGCKKRGCQFRAATNHEAFMHELTKRGHTTEFMWCRIYRDERGSMSVEKLPQRSFSVTSQFNYSV